MCVSCVSSFLLLKLYEIELNWGMPDGRTKAHPNGQLQIYDHSQRTQLEEVRIEKIEEIGKM